MQNPKKYTMLCDRGVISVTGDDSVAFLQNLITNDMTKVVDGKAIYSALLSPQGKYLFDFFVFLYQGQILLDCDVRSLGDFVQRLNLYRLRAPIKIEDVSKDFQVAAGFGESATEIISNKKLSTNLLEIAGGIAFVDPRVDSAGIRIVAVNPREKLVESGFLSCDYHDYELHRLSLALPRTSVDLLVNRSFLLETNFDHLNGIDFNKGCFVGQEVTARTKYRGLIRRRLFGVHVDGSLPVPGTSIRSDGKHVGTMMSGYGDIGLALLKLEFAGRDVELN